MKQTFKCFRIMDRANTKNTIVIQASSADKAMQIYFDRYKISDIPVKTKYQMLDHKHDARFTLRQINDNEHRHNATPFNRDGHAYDLVTGLEYEVEKTYPE